MTEVNAFDFDSDFDDDYEQSTFEQNQSVPATTPAQPSFQVQQIPVVSVQRPVQHELSKEDDALLQIQRALDDPELQRLMEEQDKMFLDSAQDRTYDDSFSYYFLIGVLVILVLLGTWILYWVRKGREIRREMKAFGYYKV